jgi:hypothetical protein
MAEAMAKINRPFPSGHKDLTERLDNAGFVDVHYRLYKQPVGLWAKEKKFKDIGGMALMTCDTGM